MKEKVIFKDVSVGSKNFQMWYEYKKDILIILQNGKNLAIGRGLWQVFNKAVDKIKDEKIIETIGEIIADIDITVSSMDI